MIYFIKIIGYDEIQKNKYPEFDKVKYQNQIGIYLCEDKIPKNLIDVHNYDEFISVFGENTVSFTRSLYNYFEICLKNPQENRDLFKIFFGDGKKFNFTS